MKVDEEKLLNIGFIVAFFLPVFGFFFRTGFLGYDSYFFLKEVCGGNTLFIDNTYFLSNALISVLPCNELLLKAILVCFFWASLLTIYAIGRVFGKKQAMLSILFVGITPILMNNSFKFENDAFAFPIMFIAVLFFIKYMVNKRQNKLELLTSIILIGIATLFWGGSIYYIILLAPESIFLMTLTIPLLWIHGPTLVSNWLPRLNIAENHPIKGVINLMVYYVVAQFGKKLTASYFKLLTAVFLFFGLLNPKFMILGLPFFALWMVKIYEGASETGKKQMIGIAIVLNFCWAMSLFFHTTEPYYIEFEAAKEIVDYSDLTGKPIKNDWGYGHMIRYYNGETGYHSTFPNFDLNSLGQSVILTRQDMNCSQVKQYDEPLFYPALRLYNC